MTTSPAEPGPDAAYAAWLAQGRLRIQRCDDCGQHVFYPRNLCPHCGADCLSWIDPAGIGTVYATSVVRRKPDAGGDYNVALIDLDEGVRMMSRVEGLPPQDVRIGMRVRARVAHDGGPALVVFDPVKE